MCLSNIVSTFCRAIRRSWKTGKYHYFGVNCGMTGAIMLNSHYSSSVSGSKLIRMRSTSGPLVLRVFFEKVLVSV